MVEGTISFLRFANLCVRGGNGSSRSFMHCKGLQTKDTFDLVAAVQCTIASNKRVYVYFVATAHADCFLRMPQCLSSSDFPKLTRKLLELSCQTS